MGGVQLTSRTSGKKKSAKTTKQKVRSKPRKETMPKSLEAFKKKLKAQEIRINELAKKLDNMAKKKTLMLKTLGMHENPRGKGKSVIDQLQHSIIKMEEFLLTTSNRIDNILSALKTHKEFLMRINKKVYKSDAKRKIRIELDIMKNTLSILVMNGIDFDSTILKEIEKLKDSIDDEKVALTEIKKRKDELDQKFNTELKRFDLGSIYSKRKILPGYL
jgi:hypothetical protein